MSWRHDDERMGLFKCDDDPFHGPFHGHSWYIGRPFRALGHKMVDNYGPGRATVSLKTHELSMQVSL